MPKRTKKPLTAAAIKFIRKHAARRGPLPKGSKGIAQSVLAKKYGITQPQVCLLLKGDKPAVTKSDKTTVKAKPARKAKAGVPSSFEAALEHARREFASRSLNGSEIVAVRAMLAEWAAPLPEFQSPFVKEFGHGTVAQVPVHGGTVTISATNSALSTGNGNGSATATGPDSPFVVGTTYTTSIPGDAPGAFEHKNGVAKETT